MISFAEQFGELDDCVYKAGDPYHVSVTSNGFVFTFYEPHNPLAAMCNYRNAHSVERLPPEPVSTAKEAPAGICAVAGFDHRPGAWK